jgi:hypothetical protein
MFSKIGTNMMHDGSEYAIGSMPNDFARLRFSALRTGRLGEARALKAA